MRWTTPPGTPLFIVRDVASRAGKARSSTGCVVSRDLEAIFMACEKEVSKGHMHGYFSEEELKSRFGTGKWRASRCFAVWQNGKCPYVRQLR